MYIDARKFDYGQFGYPDATRLVERDKEVTRGTYRNWMERNVNAIVDRQWEIDDIGAVERVGDFIKLLKEAEFTYALGAYTSTISLVGVCAEDLCRFFATSAGHNMDAMSQYKRVQSLLALGAITPPVAVQFDDIRKLRNDCLHFNAGFKQKDEATLRSDALLALNTIKAVYAAIVGVVDYRKVDAAKLSSMIDVISKEASGSMPGGLDIDSSLARTRNVFAGVFGFDISMNSPRPVYSTSMFEVLEIDGESSSPEITLRDMVSRMLVVVDLKSAEFDAINTEGIGEGDLVGATLVSVPNRLETTGLWRLWSPIHKLASPAPAKEGK